ncbi:hypothetical protein NVP1084O_086 [Vibrio phage 1.084.O._10N.261.49.F5]|nr:hypothetical protein NVP1084O_086 [Vibrio phage 1.084.O._10N.261.49.F5]
MFTGLSNKDLEDLKVATNNLTDTFTKEHIDEFINLINNELRDRKLADLMKPVVQEFISVRKLK